MSDYLYNLAARSLGPADALRPRLAPLLGPATFDSAWTGEAGPAGELPTSAPGAAPPMPSARRGGGETGAVTPIASTAPIAIGTPFARPGSVAVPAAGALSPQPLNRGHLGPVPPAETGPMTASPPKAPAVRGAPWVPAGETVRPTAPSALKTESALVPSPPRTGSDPAAPGGAGIVVRPRVNHVNEVNERRGAPGRPGTRGTPASSGSAMEPEPVIHVTIGRIEVRAINPDPPPRAARTPAPVSMTNLEKYMRREARGGGA